MAERRPSTGHNDETDLESFSDLSVDNRTFDQYIDVTSSQANSREHRQNTEIISQVRTVDGHQLVPENYGPGNDGFIRIQRTPTADDKAFVVNVLPRPALPGHPPPSVKVGKFVKNPEYLSFNSRLRSYCQHRWPLQQPSPEALANAGFFYHGKFRQDNGQEVVDQVYCYKCGESIRQWAEDDDPLEEHRRLHPACFQETWVIDGRM